MYSCDRMKTLIRLVKDYDIVKHRVYRLPNRFFKYLFEKKGNPFVILLNCLLKFNRYWTTFETLAEIERGCK